jgi:seryl-tRNA synthetase
MRKTILFKDKTLSQDDRKILAERIPYLDENISSLSVKKNKVEVSINYINKISFSNIKKKILETINSLSDPQKLIKNEALYQSKNYKIKKNINAYKQLIKSKNLSKLAEGVYSLHNNFLKLSREFDKIFLRYAKKSGYEEADYSGVLNINSLIENSYIHSFPNHCLFLSNIKRSDKILKKVSKIDINQNHKIKQYLGNPEVMLSPTVCYNCFETLKNKSIKNNLKITSISKCYRYESLNYFQLERLKVYSMRELMFFGNKKFIENQIKNCLAFFVKFLNKNKIMFRILTASDPFFLQSQDNKKIFQLANKLKYELEVYLPFEKKWIAVGSFNNHLDTLTKRYSIKNCNSGCIGIGYERFLYAFFSQKKIYKFK